MILDFHKAKASRAKIKLALEQMVHEPVSVGVAPNPRGEGWVVRANVFRIPPDIPEFPLEIDGVPVHVVVTGPIHAL